MCDSVWWRRARGALVNDFLMPTAKFYCVLTLISVGVLWLIVHFLPTTLSDGRPNLTLRDLQSRPLHGHYALFVAIISTPNHFRDRHVARRTWLRHAERSNARIAHRFFVGTPEDDASNATEADDEFVSSTASESREVRRRLAEEYAVYGDTVQLDSLDSYERLPHKVMDMFRWVAAMHANGNCSIDFVLKTDDDSYVRVDRLLQHLRAEPDGDSLYWGFFNLGSKKTRVDGIAHTSVNSAQRAAKWLDPVFNGTHYAPYALGAGYALSLALVTRIVNHATRRDDAAPPSRMEDAATGLYLDSAHGRVRRVDVWWRSVPAVRSGSNSALCQEDMVLRSHVHELALMRRWWHNYERCARMCTCASVRATASRDGTRANASDDEAAVVTADADNEAAPPSLSDDSSTTRDDEWRPERALPYSLAHLRWIAQRKASELARLRASVGRCCVRVAHAYSLVASA